MARAQHGERNGRCVLSDRDVELIRQLWDSETEQRKADLPLRLRPGAPRSAYWTTAQLAITFEVSVRQIANIISYRHRGVTSDQAEVIEQ